MPYLNFPDWQMYYEDCGCSKETIVAVHGNISTLDWWHYLVAYAKKNYRIITMDLRGCGKSSHTKMGYEIKQFAEDINELVNHLKIATFHIIGHSMGGQISLAYVLAYQEKVKTLTLVDTVPADGLSLNNEIRQGFKELQSNPVVLHRAVEECFPNFKDKEVIERIYQQAVRCAPEIYFQNPETMHKTVLLDKLKDIKIPVLLMHGRDDSVIPLAAESKTIEHLKEARVILWEKCGHSPFLEKPQGAICEFLSFVRESEQ